MLGRHRRLETMLGTPVPRHIGDRCERGCHGPVRELSCGRRSSTSVGACQCSARHDRARRTARRRHPRHESGRPARLGTHVAVDGDCARRRSTWPLRRACGCSTSQGSGNCSSRKMTRPEARWSGQTMENTADEPPSDARRRIARRRQAGAGNTKGTPRSASGLRCLGSPYGIRTRAATLRGWCPRPLDERAK